MPVTNCYTMKLTKDQLAALRYADSDKGLDYMNAQSRAFLAGVEYARAEMAKADKPKQTIPTQEEYSQALESQNAKWNRDAAKAIADYYKYPSGLQGGPRTPLDSTLDNRSGP